MWTAVKSIFAVLLTKTNNRPIIGRCRLSNGQYWLSANWPIISRYWSSADSRCTSILYTTTRVFTVIWIKAYISAYALPDNHIEHRSSSECDSSDLHSDDTVCASCCVAYQNLTYLSSKAKSTKTSVESQHADQTQVGTLSLGSVIADP